MPDTHNDGGMVFGSQVVTINSVTYIAEAANIDDDSEVVMSKDEDGVPNKQRLTTTVPSGSITLQLASDATALPPKFSIVSLTPVGGGSAIPFIIKKVGQTFQHDGETKVSVDILKQLNP